MMVDGFSSGSRIRKDLRINRIGMKDAFLWCEDLLTFHALKSSTRKKKQSPEAIAEARITRAKFADDTVLDLSGLGLSAVPASIGEFKHLERLDLSRNNLRELPTSIGNLNLRLLYLSGNKLREVPAAIGNLNLLQSLVLDGNQIRDLPSSVRNLQWLVYLNMGRNRLQSVPAAIGDLKQLVTLELYDNDLLELPIFLTGLKGLRRLTLSGNQHLGLPPEVIDRRSAAEVLDYYFRLRRGRRRELREVKVLFLGRGAVGKTSLIKQLRGQKFDKNEETTHGILIHSCQLPLLPAGRRKALGEVTAHIWDFGGQEIMHATHQFFLSRRSVYVIVLSGRTGRADEDVEYWLRIVASLGGDSPVIVVRNKIDSEYFELDEPALRAAHPQIADFVATDCEEKIGIDELGKKLIRAIGNAPGVRQEFPENWFQIKEALRDDVLKKQGKSWMRFPDFRELCANHGETDPVGQERLAGWLHDLGIALNYREDQRLNDTTVLDPLWVTRGIYAVLTSTGLAKAGGVLHETDVPKLLRERKVNAKDYPPDLQRFLIALMRKFELAYELPGKGGGDLVPELLPAKQPASVAKFPSENCTALRYRYYVLPEGLLPRFITRMHPFLEKEERWRRGAILQHEDARALVTGNDFERTVTIRVHGKAKARYRLLAMIRSDFATMHEQLKGVKPVEETEAEQAPGLWVAVGELETFERQKASELARAHAGKSVKVKVISQLNALEPAEARQRQKQVTEGIQIIPPEGRVRRGPLRLFVSYSHADEKARKKDVTAVLKVLENERLVTVWDDRMLVAGDDWDKEIREKVRTADLVLFLVTREFLISKYIKSVEAKTALKRAAAGEAKIAAVILKPCTWQEEPWAKYQVIPTDNTGAVPVQGWKKAQSFAWQVVEEQLRGAVRKIIAGRRGSAVLS